MPGQAAAGRAGRVGLVGLAGLIGFVLATALVPTQPAQADTAYRYWAFYVAHGGAWQLSQRGPASEYPVDGEVQGWRFAVQTEAAHGLPPRADADFATLCAATPEVAGEIRVGIVLDFGTTTDEPAHEHPPAAVVPGCVHVHPGDSGAAVLEAAAQVRIGTAGADEGLVCGIDGYPRSECAPAVTAPASPSPSSRPATTTPGPAIAAATTNAAAVSAPAPAPTSATASVASSAAPTVSGLAAASPESPVAELPTALSTAPPTTLAATRAATPRGHGFSVTTAIGIGLVVALALGALWRSRGRRR